MAMAMQMHKWTRAGHASSSKSVGHEEHGFKPRV
jgi:hypothetical protein